MLKNIWLQITNISEMWILNIESFNWGLVYFVCLSMILFRLENEVIIFHIAYVQTLSLSL